MINHKSNKFQVSLHSDGLWWRLPYCKASTRIRGWFVTDPDGVSDYDLSIVVKQLPPF